MAIATQVVTRIPLSGFGDYNGEALLDSSTPGFVAHTAHATALDRIWISVCNIHTSSQLMTVEVALDADDTISSVAFEYQVPNEVGLFEVVPGWVLTGSAVIRLLVPAASRFTAFGHVNRIT